MTATPPGLPPADDLIAVARASAQPILDRPRRGEHPRDTWNRALAAARRSLAPWAAEADQLVSMAGAAEYFGLGGPDVVHALRQKPPRADGTPYWPDPEPGIPGRSPLWTYRTLIAHRALAPGRGAPGIPRPHHTKRTEATT